MHHPSTNALSAESYTPNVNAPGSLSWLGVRHGDASTAFLLKLDFPTAAHQDRGAPSDAQLLINATHLARGVKLDVTLQWSGKTAHHGPETMCTDRM